MTRSPQEVFARHKEGVREAFIFRDGQIRLQTVRYTLQHTS